MVLLNSSHMELLKKGDEDDVADDDNCTCGDVNGAAADDDKMSNNFPQMPGCRLCLSCVRRL